jgi:chromosome segregation ATPase
MLSLKQAALRVGKGKSTLQRDIKAGRLSAPRDEKGRYKIDPAELARAYPDEYIQNENRDEERNVSKRPVSSQWDSMERPETSHAGDLGHAEPPQAQVHQQTAEHLALIREMVANVETAKQDEIRRLEDTIEDLRERLDKESSQNRALTAMLTDQREKDPEPEKRGFFGLFKAS